MDGSGAKNLRSWSSFESVYLADDTDQVSFTAGKSWSCSSTEKAVDCANG